MVSSVPEGASPSKSPHSLRKRVSKPAVKKNVRGRKSLSSPCDSPEEESFEKLEEIYRQVTAKVSSYRPTALETIYESPKSKRKSKNECSFYSGGPDSKENEQIVMGNVRLKRLMNFTPFYQPSKVRLKHRKNKIKAYKKGVKVGAKKGSVKVSLELVKLTLDQISDDEDIGEEVKSVSRSYHNVEDLNTSWCSRDNIIIHDESAHSNYGQVCDALGLVEPMEALNFGDNSIFGADKEDEDCEKSCHLDFDIEEELSRNKRKVKKSRRSGRVSRVNMEKLLSEEDTETNAPQLNLIQTEAKLSNLDEVLKVASNDENIANDCIATSINMLNKEFLFTELKNALNSPKNTNISRRKSSTPKKRKEKHFKSKVSKIRESDFLSKRDETNVEVYMRKSRRNSGITRKLYTSFFETTNSPIFNRSNGESPLHNITTASKSESISKPCSSPLNNIVIPNNIPESEAGAHSPTTLLSQLDINSPLLSPQVFRNDHVDKNQNLKRRSARISCIGLGSFWEDGVNLGKKEPSNDVVSKRGKHDKVTKKRKSFLNTITSTSYTASTGLLADSNAQLVDFKDATIMNLEHPSSPFKNECPNTEVDLINSTVVVNNEVSSVDTCIGRTNLTKLKAKKESDIFKVPMEYRHRSELQDFSSPILTGSFDNHVRILMGKKYRYKK